MKQSRLESLIEALFNVVIGFGINFVANSLILPLYGFHITPAQNFSMGLLYTGISIARSYVIRRWFNERLHAAAHRLALKRNEMSEKSSTPSRGVGFLGLLALLFIGLKLTGYVAWSWWWVLAPLWAVPALLVGLFGVGAVLVALVSLAASVWTHLRGKR